MANLLIRAGLAVDVLRGKGFNNLIEKSATTALPIRGDFGRQLNQYASMIDDFLYGSDRTEIVRYIRECPQVGAILFNKCNAYINGKIQVLNVLDDAQNVSPYGRRCQKVIDRPNILQNGKSFWAGVKFYMQAYGYCPVLRIKSETRGEISDMWILNPEYITIEFIEDAPYYKTDFYELVKSVKMKGKNGDWVIPKEDVYIFTDSTPLQRDSYLPSSRILLGRNAIVNLIKGYKTEGRIISKPLGAFTRKDGSANAATIKDSDKTAVRQFFSERYGTEYESQQDVLLLSAAVEWQNLMYPIAQLQIFEGRSANTAIVCDVMGYPFDLMGKDKGATYSNGGIADKVLYQNHIIPEASQIDEQIAECLLAEGNGVRYVTSYSHVPVLQENFKEKAETRKVNTEAAVHEFDNNGCTYNEYLVSIGRPETNRPFKDMYYWEIKEKFPQFITNQKQISNGNNNNQNTDTGGNQRNQGNSGNNN